MKDVKLEIIDVLDKEFVQMQKQLSLLRGIVVGENSVKQKPIIYETEVTANKNYQDYEKSRQLNKEDKELPRKFKNTTYKSHGINGRVRQRENGVYEIRCQYKGHTISVSSKILSEAKAKFDKQIESRLILTPNNLSKTQIRQTAIKAWDFADKWFETVKKPSLKEKSLQLICALHKHLKNFLGSKKFSDITVLNVQAYINSLLSAKHFVIAKHIKIYFSEVFRVAVKSGYMTQNPAEEIKLPVYENKKGVPLTIEEQKHLLSAEEPFRSCFALLLFSGCRKSELYTIKQDGKFLEIECAKQRKGMALKIRRVPISPELKRTGFDVDKIKSVKPTSLVTAFKKIFPEHHLHELRHTFITMAQECGVPREVVSVWAGHAADNTMTSQVYTHFSDDFMLKEAQKINYLDPI